MLVNENIRITEFGIRGGNSTVAFLAAIPKRYVGYDKRPAPRPIKQLAEEAGIDCSWFDDTDVRKLERIDPTDVLFIDTVHQYAQLRYELFTFARFVTSTIVLHDTATFGNRDEGKEQGDPRGLLTAVNEFLSWGDAWSVTRKVFNNNGLITLSRNHISDYHVV